jgi:ferredoxin
MMKCLCVNGHEEAIVRVHVDPEVCQGHGVCHMSAPELFLLRDEDGHAYARTAQVEGDEQADAELGAASCPEQAIVVDG